MADAKKRRQTMTSGDKRNKRLLKNTAVFAIGSFATKLISFFLIPLYTHTLTTAQYGQADLLYAICSIIYPFVTLNVAEAIFRFSMDKGVDMRKVITTGLLCFAGSALLGPVIALLISLSFNCMEYFFLLYMFIVLLSASQILLALLKGQEKLKLYMIGNLINIFCVTVCSAVFLVIMHMGVYGYFLAHVIANMITASFIVICGDVFKKRWFIADRRTFFKMTKYSIVLAPTMLMWWIMNSMDKVMIASMISDSANGIYAVSYKIPSILTAIAAIFNQAWVFSAVSSRYDADRAKYTNAIFSKLFNIICMAAVIIAIFSREIVFILTTPEYYEAWKYTPILLLGFVFTTVSTFVSTSYNVHKDSKGLLLSGVAGAVVNLFLNFILIPLIGIYGAAIATTISYIAVFAYRIFDTKKYVQIRLNKTYILSTIVLLASCMASVVSQTIFTTCAYIISIGIVACVNASTIKESYKILRAVFAKNKRRHHD